MILSVQNVSKTYVDQEVIHSASFMIEEHEKTALVGVNGAGKSTMLKIITGEVARKSLDLLDVDSLGLDGVDRNMLTTIIHKFSGGPVGLDTLSAALGEDPGTLEDVIEPYLIMQGFINRTARGRVATELAYRHLGVEYTQC